MEVEFQNGPAFTVAVARLAGGEKLRAESGAMISMTTGTQIETTTQGGILKGLKRSFSGESFFMNMFTAPPSGGEILLASPLPGDMTYVDLQGQTWLFHRDGFVASEQRHRPRHQVGRPQGRFRRLVVLRRQVHRAGQGDRRHLRRPAPRRPAGRPAVHRRLGPPGGLAGEPADRRCTRSAA